MGCDRTLYDFDFYAWTREQAALLRQGRLAGLDLANLAEEVESLGRRERRDLVDALAALLLALAKWRWLPGMRSRSEALGVKLQRMDAGRRLAESPSLRAALADLLAQAWTFAVLAAQRDTGLDASNFSADCPWTPEQALDDAFLPD